MIAHIFTERCDQCNACVAACPTHVLDIGDGAPVIARLDQCQTCYMCELYCEADAIYVGPDQHVQEAVDPAAILASGHLGRIRQDHGWDRAPDPGTQHLDDYRHLGPLLREGGETAARHYHSRKESA